jgi:hypothetical protein
LFYCVAYLIKRRKIGVMQAKPAGEFPNPFDRIELRAVGRQEVELETG